MKLNKSFCLFLAVILCFLTSITAFAESDKEYEYYVENGCAVLTKYLGDSKKVSVPETIDGYSVVKLSGTFCENDDIKSVEIPEGITTIGEKTFYKCTDLKKVEIPVSVSELGFEAFAYSGIKDIVLGPLVYYVNPRCFIGCENLFSVEFKAEASFGSSNTCYIAQDAFADSSVVAFFGVRMPEFYNPVYDARFLEIGSVGYYLNKTILLKPMLELLLKETSFSFLLAFLYVLFLLAIIITVVIVVSRFILSVSGRNNVALYRLYNRWIMNETGSDALRRNVIRYKKLEFKSDVFLRVLKTIGWILAALVFLSVFALVTVNIDILPDNSFLKSCVVFVGCLVTTIIIVLILLKIRCVINEHKKFSDKPRVRIKKIRKGGEKDAQ